MECKKCGNPTRESGKCNCRVFIIVDEDGEEFERRGYDYEHAAESFAENHGSDYNFFGGVCVTVKDVEAGTVKNMEVSAEQITIYTAREENGI